MDPLRDPLTEAELNGVNIGEMLRESGDGGTVISRVIAPEGGKVVREDGTVKVAIMRPCISRGARLRGLPPIYTQGMLSENADVFTGWPMFRDHALVIENAQEEVAEAELIAEAEQQALEEAVKKIGRSVDDLVGRMVRSWYDPELVYEDDSNYGYQPGGIVGYAKLIRSLRERVEDDPGLMHLSINGYPRSGRPGFAPWSPKTRGMVVEGIRRVPQGSVDVVVRGGAGGRFLMERDAREVSSRGRYYASADDAMDLSKMTPDQLREHVTQNAPHLLPALAPAGNGGGAQGGNTPPVREGASQELDAQQILAEAEQRFEAKLAERQTQLREEFEQKTSEERATERLHESLSRDAATLIEAAETLPASWKADLKQRWAITESGASPALAQIEPEKDAAGNVTKDAKTVLKEAVDGDLQYAAKLIAEAKGGPVVTGEGSGTGSGTGAVTEGQQPQRKTGRQWDDDLADSGIIERDDKGAPKIDGLLESMAG